MARVTVEDCIRRVQNRFKLVFYASHRARQIAAGARETIDRDRDRNPVLALREIAEGTIDLEELDEEMILKLCRHQPDEPGEEGAGPLPAAAGAEKPPPQMTEDEMLKVHADMAGEQVKEAEDSGETD